MIDSNWAGYLMLSNSADRANRYASEHDEDWAEPKPPRRDWKKLLLVIGLGTLSWVATYVGMLELIQANMGTLDFSTKIVVGFSVAMLMTMIIWLLDQIFAPHPFAVKLSYLVGYAFLTLISVGFGFGFYWKVLESRSEASRSAESAITQVQASLLAGSARLDQLQGTLQQLTLISQKKAMLEKEKGTSCPNSRPGDGPRRRLRDDDAGRFSFASNFVKGRSSKVKSDMRALDGDLKKITSSDPSTFDKVTGTRNKFLQALSRKLELTATSFNAFRTDPQLRQIRTELAERANRSTFPTGRGSGTFSCPDGQLQSALYGVVKAIDQLPELGKPQIATVEGAQAVVEAFRRLTATLQGALVLKLPPSADELRALQTQAVRSVSPNNANRRATSSSGLSQGGLSQRDYIPLAIALFVDLCLLLVSIGRPMNRLNGLVPKMREAERGPIYQILSKFDDIHRDPQIREKFEVFRHVVFDFHGDYYVAVPLDAPRNRNPDEVKNLQQEAHLLGNLFASFEKEKIFSRVYNPLLSSKTIQKKLWRQGSKFAASQAFRTYRFRDGAWSDIILGAVMGAARRAKTDRILQAQQAGPQLGMPATHTDDPAEARAREIIAEMVGREMACIKKEFAVSPLVGGQPPIGDPDADVAQMASAFSPFGNQSNPTGRGAEGAENSDAKAWPYRKPPSPPGEADVDLMPANSNTSPHEFVGNSIAAGADMPRDAGSAASDNVILMPLPSVSPVLEPEPAAQLKQQMQGIAGAPFADVLADAIAVPAEVDAVGVVRENQSQHDGAMVAEIVEPRPPLGPPTFPAQTPISEQVETSMNVRIVQRTADFKIPMRATSNGQPIDFVRAGMSMGSLTQAASLESVDQLALDFQVPDTVDVTVPDAREFESPEMAAPSADQPVFLLETITDDEADDVEMIGHDKDFDDSSEVELEEISRRFAPKH
jgi:hypothetical protein